MICLFWFVSSSSRTRARAVLSLGDQHLRQIMIIANGINSQTSNNLWPFLPSQHCTFFQGRLVILLSLHAKTLHSLIKIFQDSLDFGRIRGVLEDRRRKVIVRQVLSQIWKMYLFIIPHICHFFTQAKFLENKIYTEKRVNYDKLHSKLPIFRVKSVKNLHRPKKI